MVIGISGKARTGKDTVARELSELYKKDGLSTIILHFADLLKWQMTVCTGINSSEVNKHREELCEFASRAKEEFGEDYLVQYMHSTIDLVSHYYDVVIVADCRLLPEVVLLQEYCAPIVRVVRDVTYVTTEKAIPYETALDDYPFRLVLHNDGSLQDLKNKCISMKKQLRLV